MKTYAFLGQTETDRREAEALERYLRRPRPAFWDALRLKIRALVRPSNL